jgi:hypothetical protein
MCENLDMRLAKPLPKLEFLHEALIHNKDGSFTWKERPLHHFPDLRAMRIWNTKYAGIVFRGSERRNGYLYMSIFNSSYATHRIAWFMHTSDCPNNMEIDHINNIRSDNRISNLRLATPNNNQHNKIKSKNNTSGHKNVVWNKQCGKWQVKMNHNKSYYHFGLFDDIEEAARCASESRAKLHKQFANDGY